jgi:hypothetical protein
MILLGSTCTWKIVYAGTKMVNTHQYKASRRHSTQQGGHGPHGGAAQYHKGAARLVSHMPLPRHWSVGEVLQGFSTIDLKLVQHQRLEWSSTWIADVSWQRNQHEKHLQPFTPTHNMWAKLLEEGGGPTCHRRANWCPIHAASAPQWPNHHPPTSSMPPCTLDDLKRPFQVGSMAVSSNGGQGMSRGSLMWRWSSPYSTLGYK